MKRVAVEIRRDKPGLGSSSAGYHIRRAVRATLSSEGLDLPGEVAVLLTNDEGIRVINRESRGIDASTDVLSFPASEQKAGAFETDLCEIDPSSRKVFLGDIVISLERARLQGREYGHGAKREICYLAVHSVLHLLGYDHLDEGVNKMQMRDHEKAAIRLLGFGKAGNRYGQ